MKTSDDPPVLTETKTDGESGRGDTTYSSEAGQLSPETGAPRTRFIPTLDGWRALAVLLVIANHETEEHLAQLPRFLSPLLHAGSAGVKIFFGISGYLICTLLLLEYKQRGSISLRHFYTRRAFRILPPAFAYLGFLLIATLAGWQLVRAKDLLAPALLMANNLSPTYVTYHFWSLSLEEQFYLLWPAMLALLRPARAAWIAGAAFLAITFWKFIYGLWWPVPANRSDMALDVFFAPCCLAIILSNPVNRERAVHLLRGWMFLLLIGAVAVFELTSSSDELRHSVYAILFPLIVISTVLHPSWTISRFFDLGPVRWVGRISYSLYLWQQFFTWAGLPHIPFAARIAGVFGTATVSYYFIELPFIRLGRRLLLQKTVRATA